MDGASSFTLRPGERCGIENCRARKFHRNDHDGFYYCENGHRREGVQAIGEDEDAFGTQGKKTRKRGEEREKTYQLFQGKKAFELYLQCYQLVLRKQIWWLVHNRGLPAELEVVIFDLWALRLSNLKEKIEDASDTDTQSQMYSSQSEGESDTENENRQGRRGRKTDATPSLLDALALCYLGMITLRLPMTLGDLYQAATKGDIVYLRAIKQIPVPMKERLPAQYHAALDPRSLLKPDRLQNAVINLDIAYSRDFGVVFPSLNHPLLLLRYMKELALPLEIYPAVRRLAHLVSYTFSYPTNMERQLRVTDFPENQFASLVIVATKLFYPFDDLKRYPHTPTEPAAAQMDWKAWIRLTKEAQAKEKLPGKLSYEDAMKTKESDVFAMDDMDMDQYLDWYQRTWADEDVRDQDKDAEFRRAMSSMFPIDSGAQQASVPATDDAQQSKMEKVKAVQGALKPRRVITEEEAEEYQREINRPGSKYKQYRHESDLPEHAKAFYEAVAKLTGVSLNTLVQAVFLTERKLQKWVDAERRKEYGEVEDEYES